MALSTLLNFVDFCWNVMVASRLYTHVYLVLVVAEVQVVEQRGLVEVHQRTVVIDFLILVGLGRKHLVVRRRDRLCVRVCDVINT